MTLTADAGVKMDRVPLKMSIIVLKVFFHYTSKEGKNDILRDMCINPSSGPGVNLTKMAPGDYSKEEVANAIYGNNCK